MNQTETSSVLRIRIASPASAQKSN